MELKLLTLNTWKGDGDYPARLALLAKQLQMLSPDVILLQEVLKTTDYQHSTIKYLANELNFHSSFLPMRRKKRVVEGAIKDSFSGMGCLSKYPIQYMEAVPLPSNEADGGRVAQLVKINIQEQHFLFGNIHLSFLSNSDDLKIKQLDALLLRMAAHEDVKGYFLAGDFNSERESRTMQHLLLHSLFKARDTYLAAGNKDAGFTIISNENPNLGKRIDYIFSLATPAVPHLPIIKSEVTLNQPENDVFPSDHFGVMTTFKLPDHYV